MFKLILFSLFIILFLPGVIFASSSTIQVNDKGFYPDKIEIKQADTVIFTNIGKEDHWPASDIHPTHGIYPEFDPKKPVKSGQSWQFKFDKIGQWRFHDHLNPFSTGTIIVSAPARFKPETILDKLANFFKKLFQFKAQRPFDANISESSQEIFKSDDALYSYVKKFGPKKTMIQLNQLVPSYGDCHQNAHKTGRFAYEIYKDKAFQLCSAECHSGCYHGATESYFRDHGTQNLNKDLNLLCSSELNSFFSHQCIHGVGHGLMAFANYQLDEALNDCNLLTKRQDSCYTGVFMENIVGGLADQHSTKYLNSDPQYPCNIVDDKYKGSCYFLQTSRMMQLFSGDFQKIAQACIQTPQIYQRTCFESMGRDVGGVYRYDPSSAISACQYAPSGDLRIGCLIGAVQDSFWDPTGQDDAIKFCKKLVLKEEKSACYKTISARSPDVLLSEKDRLAFCDKVERDYQNDCYSLAH